MARRPIDHKLEVDVPVCQIDKVLDAEFGLKVPSQIRCIFRSDSKADQRSRIAKHRVPNARIKLVQVLVRQHKADAVFAKLAHHIREHEAGEALKLIEIDEERPPLVR